MTEQHKVGFNPDQKEMWEQLRKQGLTSKPFPTFVKDAFYDAIDKLNIEKLAFKATQHNP